MGRVFVSSFSMISTNITHSPRVVVVSKFPFGHVYWKLRFTLYYILVMVVEDFLTTVTPPFTLLPSPLRMERLLTQTVRTLLFRFLSLLADFLFSTYY